MAELIAERGVERPIAEVPTGVDVEFYAAGQRDALRRELGLSEKNLVLGHLGRLAPEKNLEYLARAAAEATAGHENTWFLVVGSGPSEDEIRRIFSQAGVEKRLILAGRKTGPDLADAYAAMDLFLFASRSETQGMVLTEAMAAGKPVIALDASGAREVVRDGRNGRLLPGDASTVEFAAAVVEAAGDRGKLEQMSRQAVATAREFSREKCSRKLADLYTALVREHQASGAEKTADHSVWDMVLERLKAEWDLAAGVASAAVEALYHGRRGRA